MIEKIIFNVEKPGKHNLIVAHPIPDKNTSIIVQISLSTEIGKRAILNVDYDARQVSCLSNRFKLLSFSFANQEFLT